MLYIMLCYNVYVTMCIARSASIPRRALSGQRVPQVCHVDSGQWAHSVIRSARRWVSFAVYSECLYMCMSLVYDICYIFYIWCIHIFIICTEVTLEIVIGRAWACIGQTECEVELLFRGILPSPSHVVLTGGQRVSSAIRVTSPLGTYDINPTGNFFFIYLVI